TAFGWLMVSGYTGCTWAEGRAPRGRDPSADSEARIRRGRAQLVPRWTSNPGGNALNPRGLGGGPPHQPCSFPLIFRRARSGAIQGGHPFRPENAEAIQGPAPILHRHRPFFEAFRKAKYSSFMAASSFGNDPRILMILRSDMFSDSIVLVVRSEEHTSELQSLTNL